VVYHGKWESAAVMKEMKFSGQSPKKQCGVANRPKPLTNSGYSN